MSNAPPCRAVNDHGRRCLMRSGHEVTEPRHLNREYFTVPESASLTMPPEGGLKPGDIVSVRAIVISECIPTPGKGTDTPWVNIQFDGAQLPYDYRTIDPAHLTLIERPAPAEPEWQPGDLAEDERGSRYANHGIRESLPWLKLNPEEGEVRWYSRAQIPGPLFRLTVTRDEGV